MVDVLGGVGRKVKGLEGFVESAVVAVPAEEETPVVLGDEPPGVVEIAFQRVAA